MTPEVEAEIRWGRYRIYAGQKVRALAGVMAGKTGVVDRIAGATARIEFDGEDGFRLYDVTELCAAALQEPGMPGYANVADYQIAKGPALADWECEMFGLGRNYVLRPDVNHVPNAWWRFWQFVILGNRWVKVKPEARS